MPVGSWGAGVSLLLCLWAESVGRGGETLPPFCPALFTHTLHKYNRAGWKFGLESVLRYLFALCLLYYNGNKSVCNSVVRLLYLQWTVFSCTFLVCWESGFLQVYHTVYFNKLFFTEAFGFLGLLLWWMLILLVQWMCSCSGDTYIFGSLHSHYKASRPMPWQLNVSGTSQALRYVCGVHTW